MTRDEAMTPILIQALKDPEYRKRLKADPKSVIQGEFGVTLPESLEIEVVEETAQKLYVVIPPRPAEGELIDEQLEAVAGGLCFPVAPMIALAMTVSVGSAAGAKVGWGQRIK
jgi:hypothetical protein